MAGVGNSHTIVITFNHPPVSGSASVTESTAVAGAPSFSGNDMIVPLTGVANAQYVTVTVSNVSSSDGFSGGTGSVRLGCRCEATSTAAASSRSPIWKSSTRNCTKPVSAAELRRATST